MISFHKYLIATIENEIKCPNKNKKIAIASVISSKANPITMLGL